MARHVLLDNVTHKDLKIVTNRSERYGDNVICTAVFPIEFTQLLKEYPIVFRQNTLSNRLEPVALFGLDNGENLFLADSRWDAKYIPLTIERQPFLIGFQEMMKDGVPVQTPVVHIDMDSPRISQDQGEPVFLEHGGNSPYLERINSVLLAIHEGHEHNQHFSAALEELKLLEPFTLKIEFDNHHKHELKGFYTINEDALKLLGGEALEQMHQSGYLASVYMMLASLSNIKSLIDKKNEKIAASGAD